MSRKMELFYETAHRLSSQGEDFVVVTWLKSEGHAPQDLGAKAIITAPQGLAWGTVGGGKVEAKAIRLGLELLSATQNTHNEPLQLRWDLQKDVGMSCGGSVHFLFEIHRHRRWPIVVFGAGHVGQALVRNLLLLDCSVTCIDARPEWLERLPQNLGDTKHLKVVHAEDMPRYAADIPGDSYCVLVSKGHDTDRPILSTLLKRAPSLPFIGVIGSKVKARKIRAELMNEGFSTEAIHSVSCPIGLFLGSNQPEEIAVSIIAQLLVIKHKNAAPTLITERNSEIPE